MYYEDDIEDQEFIRECMNCECCQGNVYDCEGETCQALGSCYCLMKLEVEKGKGHDPENVQDV